MIMMIIIISVITTTTMMRMIVVKVIIIIITIIVIIIMMMMMIMIVLMMMMMMMTIVKITMRLKGTVPDISQSTHCVKTFSNMHTQEATEQFMSEPMQLITVALWHWGTWQVDISASVPCVSEVTVLHRHTYHIVHITTVNKTLSHHTLPFWGDAWCNG